MVLQSQLVVFCAIAGSWALPTAQSTYAVKERHFVPRGWTAVGRAPKEEHIHLQLGLKQRNEGVVERHLLEVSDPRHARYGQHLTSAEIHDIISPSDETLAVVHAWLLEHDVEPFYNPSKDWVSVVLPIEKAERLLQTEYSVFAHEDGARISRAPEWSLPLHLHEHIDVVQPTTSFFRPRARRSHLVLDDAATGSEWWAREGKALLSKGAALDSSSVSAVCNVNFTTPTCLRTLYGTIDYTPQVPGQNRIGITDYLNETSYRADIYKFLAAFRPEAAQSANTFEIIQIANAINNQGPYTPAEIKAELNIEADLDAEVVLSETYPTPLTVFTTGGSPPFVPDEGTPTDTNEPYLSFLNYALAQSSLPQVITTSYGDDEQSVPLSYALRVCSGFAQLGARGISILFSSGDSGVGPPHDCHSNSPSNNGTRMFLPEFPTSCPWVTSVGATANFEPETAVFVNPLIKADGSQLIFDFRTRFASGAGFSNVFAQPSYQQSAVQAYLAGLDGLNAGLYNASGRAYPDVAAQGNHDAIVWALNTTNITTVGGTSASSPLFASVISLVNDALIAKGKPALGFLNPWLYGGAYKALTDITIGHSYGCGTHGFPAAVGWDAVTGWGTPNFGALVDAAFEAQGAAPPSWPPNGPPSWPPSWPPANA